MSVGVASLWNDPIGGVWIAGFARLLANHHSTFLVNSWAHFFGKQPFSSHCTARDSILVGLLAHGEGYHNYHHQFAADYRNAIRWWQYDPTKWMIYAFSKMGLAYDLKRIEPRVVMAYRIKRLAEISWHQSESLNLAMTIDDFVKPFKKKLNLYFDQLEAVKNEYNTLKNKKIKLVNKVRKAKLKQVQLRKKELLLQINVLFNEAELMLLRESLPA
jgi:stearoyl-CoA desaturase (delta-9 desaturase)